MSIIKQFLFVLFLSLFFNNIVAQQKAKPTVANVLQQGTIEQQFDIVYNKSGKYLDNKVVKRTWLEQLKTNTSDSLKAIQVKLNAAKIELAGNANTITGIQEKLNNTKNQLTKVTEEKDSLSFFGSNVSKTAYKTIMWAIVGLLLGLLGFFIFKFKNSNAITVQAKKALSEIELEYEDHRRRALEREQQVRRKLQDEINKQRKAGAK